MPARTVVLAALACGGVLLTACGSGSSAPATTSAPTTTRSPGGATTTSSPTGGTTTTTSSPGGTTTTGLTGAVRCASTALTASVTGSSGAAGTIETTVALRSTATTPCGLAGYPGLQMLSASGSDLPTQVVRGGTYSFTAMAPTTVLLAPGQSALFNIGYSDVPVGNETTCPTSASVEVTPPNASDHLVLTAALAPCGRGTLAVSPVFPAVGAGTQTTAPPSG